MFMFDFWVVMFILIKEKRSIFYYKVVYVYSLKFLVCVVIWCGI